MKISIDTGDSHILTEYLMTNKVETPETAPVSAAETAATEETTSSTASAESDVFSTLLNTAIDALATRKNAEQAQALGTEIKTLDDLFNTASQTYGVDVNLLKAVAMTESGFQPYTTSKSGAMGIMQIMPSTAEYLGLTNAYDPYENIMGGARLLSELLNKYGGDTSLALAAYNAGSSNVDKYGGIPPFEETQNYVPKVLGYYSSGVTIPDELNIATPGAINYTATANSLKSAISQFAGHESYDLFLKELENEMNKTPDTTQTIYQSLMSATSRAITSTMENYKGQDN